MYSGPHIKRDGLVFGYDTGRNPSSNFDHRINKRRHFRGKPTVNFFPDGHFPDGNDMESEAGSNSQNDVVLLKNPGDSPYVLRQTMGVASTEYQINLTTQLSANTTYVLSGWYAESTDYNASNRMFHCRAFSAGGNHRALGNGIYNVINTKIVNGITWRHCYATITTPSDYSNNFNWYVGYSSDSYSGARYYTNLKMEQGSYPTPYVAGTRSSTQSLIDLTKTTDIDVSNVSFDSNGLPTFDGTDDYIIAPDNDLYTFSDAVGTWEACIKPTGNAGVLEHNIMCKANYSYNTREYQFQVRYSGGVYYIYLGQNNNNSSWRSIGSTSTSNISLNQWYHVVVTSDGNGNAKMYINGELTTTATGWHTSQANLGAPLCIGATINGTTPIQEFVGNIAVAKLYNINLSPQQVKQNFRAYKTRFDI